MRHNLDGQRAKIVVVGAGFAGLRAVKSLSQVDAEVLLIDAHNYHTFIPLLYQVATGFIEPELIAYPLRRVVRGYRNTNFLLAQVTGIDFVNQRVVTDSQTIAYDYLVIATGSKTNFLGVSGAPQHTFPLRTLEDAISLRNQIIRCFEQAAKAVDDVQLQAQLMRFVIVGGGATGVEMAGALQELIHNCLVKDYPQLDPNQVQIILLQSGTSLLSVYPKRLRQYTLRQLRDRGIKVHFNSRVSATSVDGVCLEDNSTIAAATIIWTAGIEANIPTTDGDLTTVNKNKIEVLPTLQLPEYPQVYAVGDVAYIKQDGEPLLSIAPEALQQGSAIANNLKRQLKGRSPQAFNYFNKGSAAIIARNAGVAYLFGKVPLQGFFGWLLWLGIHAYYLPGLSNRGKLLVAWLKDYLWRDRSVRQIITFGQKK